MAGGSRANPNIRFPTFQLNRLICAIACANRLLRASSQGINSCTTAPSGQKKVMSLAMPGGLFAKADKARENICFIASLHHA